MTKHILKRDIIDIKTMCNDAQFVKHFKRKINARLYKVIALKHGHTPKGQIKFTQINQYIKPLRRAGKLTPRYIRMLYYLGLFKIKEIIQHEYSEH